jgi:hypothetical protein
MGEKKHVPCLEAEHHISFIWQETQLGNEGGRNKFTIDLDIDTTQLTWRDLRFVSGQSINYENVMKGTHVLSTRG